jgi:hypothetical protein
VTLRVHIWGRVKTDGLYMPSQQERALHLFTPPPPFPARADFSIMGWDVRQKWAIATLCVLCVGARHSAETVDII